MRHSACLSTWASPTSTHVAGRRQCHVVAPLPPVANKSAGQCASSGANLPLGGSLRGTMRAIRRPSAANRALHSPLFQVCTLHCLGLPQTASSSPGKWRPICAHSTPHSPADTPLRRWRAHLATRAACTGRSGATWALAIASQSALLLQSRVAIESRNRELQIRAPKWSNQSGHQTAKWLSALGASQASWPASGPNFWCQFPALRNAHIWGALACFSST